MDKLAEPFTITLQSFMKHVRMLETSGLIRTSKSGRVGTCALNRDRLWTHCADRLDQFVTNRQEIQWLRSIPRLDLMLHRGILAPGSAVWRAWTELAQLQRWWVPAPTVARIDQLDVQLGSEFVSSMSNVVEMFVPHTDSIFLVTEPETRLVFTNAINSAWRPATSSPSPMTAEITFSDHPKGIDYLVVVIHGDPADRDGHKQLGFYDGWGSVTAALASLVESEATT